MRENIDIKNLVDITAVKVNKDLPQVERSKDFKRQIKDTTLYGCEGFIIHAVYATNGDKIEDCFRGMKA